MKYFDVNLQLRLASNFSHSYNMQKQKKNVLFMKYLPFKDKLWKVFIVTIKI